MKIKNKIQSWLISGAVLLGLNSFGQSNSGGGTPQSFTQGTNVINLGVGVGGYYTYWGSGYSSTPNFVISYENGTFGNVGPGTISLGGLLSYKDITHSWVDGYNYSEKWTYWILGFRSAYHWNFTSNDKFDPYAGLMLGYYVLNYSYTSNDPNYNRPGDPYYGYYGNNYNNYMALSLFLGARYYVSSKVGFWGELGWGYTTLALGVNFKL